MRMPTHALITMAFIAAALSGCVGAADDQNVDVGAGADASASAGNGTVEADAAVEADVNITGPVVAVDVSGDDVAANVTENGTIYQALAGGNITFDASNTTDEADGNLSFAWDFGDGNVSEGAVVNHAFAIEGNFTVTMTAINDETQASGTTTLAFVVSAGANWEIPEPLVFEGVMTAYGENSDCATHVVPVGGPLSSMTYHIEHTSTTSIDFDYWVYNPDGDEEAERWNYNEPTGTAYGEAEDDVVIDEPGLGDWSVVVCAYTAHEGGYRMTVSFA